MLAPPSFAGRKLLRIALKYPVKAALVLGARADLDNAPKNAPARVSGHDNRAHGEAQGRPHRVGARALELRLRVHVRARVQKITCVRAWVNEKWGRDVVEEAARGV